MLFLRTSMLIGLGILLMPTDAATQAKVADGARAAVGWTMTFCERNGATCEKGREGWDVFKKKAEFSAKMAYDLISERTQLAAEASKAQAKAPAPSATPASTRNTLKPEDVQPAWRGKKVASAGG